MYWLTSLYTDCSLLICRLVYSCLLIHPVNLVMVFCSGNQLYTPVYVTGWPSLDNCLHILLLLSCFATSLGYCWLLISIQVLPVGMAWCCSALVDMDSCNNSVVYSICIGSPWCWLKWAPFDHNSWWVVDLSISGVRCWSFGGLSTLEYLAHGHNQLI